MGGWKGVIGLIAAGTVLGELAESLAPEGWRERIGRIAALAVLAALVLRLPSAVGAGERIGEAAQDLVRSGEARVLDGQTGREAWIGAAEFAFAYLRELGLDAEGAEFAVDVPEEGEPAVRIFVPGCPYTERMRIGEDLGAAFGVEVRVETGKEGGR
ncbi:MAG: hypothetical protein II779_12670 [Clostridia bacterium]|nr:hypothetical protein [Clostridia bacterium]